MNNAARAREKTTARRRLLRSASRSVSDQELEGWVEEAKDLPDLRWEKVKALRDQLARGEYDLDRRLDELFERLPAALQGLDQPALPADEH